MDSSLLVLYWLLCLGSGTKDLEAAGYSTPRWVYIMIPGASVITGCEFGQIYL